MCQNYAKCELKKIHDYERRIAILDKEVACLKDKANSSTAPISGNGGGSSKANDKLGEYVPKYVDMEAMRDVLAVEAEKHRRKCFNLINSLTKVIYTDVLYARYFENKSFVEISDEFGYSERNVGYIHGYALQELNEILKGENANVTC